MKGKRMAFLTVLVPALLLAACTQSGTAPAPAPSATDAATDATSGEAQTEEAEDRICIPVVAKGFQHQFWQAVRAGSERAAEDLGVEMHFDAPETETDIDTQVEMFRTELKKDPDAIALAALSTEAVKDLLKECKEKNIPVVGFDSGIPDDTSGAVVATAATNNEAAAGIAAEQLGGHESVLSAMKNATVEKPAVIAVISQDATSDSITGRTTGFVDRMAEIAEEHSGGPVSVEGHGKWEKKKEGAAVIIRVEISETTDISSVRACAETVLETEGLCAVFCSNEGTVNGFLEAVAGGEDLAPGNRYEGLAVVGFDAGYAQKNAIRKGWFYGSVTQDPYAIGYNAVEMAYKAATGERVSDVDTGARWYDADNIDDEDIALLVYD